MIEGLKVTVGAEELRGLCVVRAKHHRERAQAYGEQVASFDAAQLETRSQYTGKNPREALRDKQRDHLDDAGELDFIGAHLKTGEEYLLDREDLRKLGIAKDRW